MNKLLCAGFSRLKKDKIFWFAVAAMFVYAVIYMLNGCRQATSDTMSEYNCALDQYYFHYGMFIGMFVSVVTGMFLGTEYNDGTIRNKLVIGHTRTAIYLSNFILSFSASLAILLAWFIGALIGIPTLGFWRMGTSVLIYFLISILYVAAFSAIFTFLGMLVTRRSLSGVLSILFFFCLLVLGSSLYQALQEPEFNNSIIITASGVNMGDPVPNPLYLTGMKREIYQFLVDFLPTGQGMQMFDLNIQHPLRMILCSIGLTGGVTAIGLYLFRKKNLN